MLLMASLKTTQLGMDLLLELNSELKLQFRLKSNTGPSILIRSNFMQNRRFQLLAVCSEN